MKPNYYTQTFHFSVGEGEDLKCPSDLLTLNVHVGGKFERSELCLHRIYHDRRDDCKAFFKEIPTTIKFINSLDQAEKIYTSLMAQLAGLNNE